MAILFLRGNGWTMLGGQREEVKPSTAVPQWH